MTSWRILNTSSARPHIVPLGIGLCSPLIQMHRSLMAQTLIAGLRALRRPLGSMRRGHRAIDPNYVLLS